MGEEVKRTEKRHKKPENGRFLEQKWQITSWQKVKLSQNIGYLP